MNGGLRTQRLSMFDVSARRLFACIAATFFLALNVFAQTSPAFATGAEDGVPAPDGPTLAAELRSLPPGANASGTGALRIRGRGAGAIVLPVTSQVVKGDTNWSMIYVTPGAGTHRAERLVVVHSTNAPNLYLRAVASAAGADPGEPKPVPLAGADVPFAGSDFLLSDLGLEFLHWPEQRRIKGELRLNRSCHVLESKRAAAPAGGYSRVLSWVDKETGGLLLAEAYDADGRLLKEFSIGSLKKVNGTYQLQDMEILNRLSGSRTRIEFDLGGR
jgi:hypothetical protein